jgi:hypothetical protein
MASRTSTWGEPFAIDFSFEDRMTLPGNFPGREIAERGILSASLMFVAGLGGGVLCAVD